MRVHSRPKRERVAAALALLLASMLPAMFALAHATAEAPVDRVKVAKSERTLYLLHGDVVVATFPIALGGNPRGHKQQEGDRRTPEGRYVLDFKKADSAYFKSIHVSYPNEADRRRAREHGVAPGDAIMIHGQPNGMGALAASTQRFDWTDGCIALSNEDMQQVWDHVHVPVPIEIAP